jgi:hypothetical protein
VRSTRRWSFSSRGAPPQAARSRCSQACTSSTVCRPDGTKAGDGPPRSDRRGGASAPFAR